MVSDEPVSIPKPSVFDIPVDGNVSPSLESFMTCITILCFNSFDCVNM